MTPTRSPLAPATQPILPPIAGVRLATGESGIRYKGRDDILFATFAAGTAVAGVYTRSGTAAAPVLWCRKAGGGGRARVLVVNAGNANAFTGPDGMAAVEVTAAAAARLVDCPPRQVFVGSTGVIGVALPAGKIAALLPRLKDRLDADAWSQASRAIMTTDTFPKVATRTTRIADRTVTLNGIAKGSGMIQPDMATMLAYVATDAKLAPDVARTLLAGAVKTSFNCITVDSDTSTNDTLMLFATGAAANPAIARAGDPRLRAFRAALDDLCLDLALQVVRDGEGAQKLIEVAVAGAKTAAQARTIALAVANSPLVKTAIAGEDANWGRIVMAVGKADPNIDQRRLSVAIGGVVVADRGGPPKSYDEAPVARHMKGREIGIAIDLGAGRAGTKVWTCDLTHGYIDINADYRS